MDYIGYQWGVGVANLFTSNSYLEGSTFVNDLLACQNFLVNMYFTDQIFLSIITLPCLIVGWRRANSQGVEPPTIKQGSVGKLTMPNGTS